MCKTSYDNRMKTTMKVTLPCLAAWNLKHIADWNIHMSDYSRNQYPPFILASHLPHPLSTLSFKCILIGHTSCLMCLLWMYLTTWLVFSSAYNCLHIWHIRTEMILNCCSFSHCPPSQSSIKREGATCFT